MTDTLTGPEREVLALLPLGLTTPEIARRVYKSHSTVKTHLNAAFRKLGVHSRYEAADWARAHMDRCPHCGGPL